MKTQIKDTLIYDVVVFSLLGLENGIAVRVLRENNEQASSAMDAYRTLTRRVEGVRQYPNNEVDLLQTMAGSSGTWERIATVKIPDEHMPAINKLFKDDVELTHSAKNEVLHYLAMNA